MSKEKFEAFKASDAQKKPLPRGNKPSEGEQASEAVSAGFPTIEGMLEAERLDLEGIDLRLAQLADLAENGSAKDKGTARKAAAAYEKTRDLMEFLWDTKGGLGAEEGG